MIKRRAFSELRKKFLDSTHTNLDHRPPYGHPAPPDATILSRSGGGPRSARCVPHAGF